MKKLFILLTALFILKTCFATFHFVDVSNHQFNPATVNAVVGDTMVWRWVDGSHTTTSGTIPPGAASWNSNINTSNRSFTYVITVAGTYNYKCTPHEAMGEVGVIIVGEPLPAENIGIGTTSPASSAMLDVTSTTKGFLPPRMTSVQRDAIASPVTGLTIYNTDNKALESFNGTAWAASSRSSNAHFIGENYGGGIVFYVAPGALHGLIAETLDQGASVSWYKAQDVISTAVNHSSAGIGFTDWRLPTKNELHLLYFQRNAVGGFGNFVYWSSLDFNGAGDAWGLNFGTGEELGNLKSDAEYVRGIRAF